MSVTVEIMEYRIHNTNSISFQTHPVAKLPSELVVEGFQPPCQTSPVFVPILPPSKLVVNRLLFQVAYCQYSPFDNDINVYCIIIEYMI